MADKVFVPPIKIQGIKTKIVPLIKQVAEFADSDVWFEPFMGSGVVGFNVAPKRAFFSDTNPYLIAFYQAIQDGEITPANVRAYLEFEGKKLSELDDEYYYEVRNRFNRHHDPFDFLFLNRACFNGMIRFNKKGEFNVPYGHKPQRFAKAYVTKIVNQVANVEAMLRLNDWHFSVMSFDEVIPGAESGSFIYCDPPYIGRHVDYFDSWDEENEVTLHELLMAHQGKFMLSTWDHNSYRTNDYVYTLWHECHKTTREHFYHVGARESNRNAVIEALLTNYAPAAIRPEGERVSLAPTQQSLAI